MVDTVKMEREKAILLTEGAKSTKDTLFFLTPNSDSEPKANKAKPPINKRAMNGAVSPPKKTVGGKVLRHQTRSAAQEEVLMTAAAKIADHQKELHTRLQTDGLAKYSEDGGGTGGKEGKGWKRFQSYKGEAAVPKEAESMRVRSVYLIYWRIIDDNSTPDIRGPQVSNRHFTCSRLRCSVPYKHHKKCEQE